jgi:poly(hydroxyalkanoate) granule-associated protein
MRATGFIEESVKQARDTGRDALRVGREVWLAGLGVMQSAQVETTRTFDTLVAKGRRVEERQRKTVHTVQDEVTRRVEEASGMVRDGVQRVVAGTLHRFGVPTRTDVAELQTRVEQLQSRLKTLSAV